MSGEIDLHFEELPLIVEAGFQAGLVNGTATISYEADGEWFLTSLALGGHRQRTEQEIFEARAKWPDGPEPALFERKPVCVDSESYPWLYLAILHQFENGTFKAVVEDAVQAALAGDREDAADNARDRIRDDRAEHSTLTRAHQGV